MLSDDWIEESYCVEFSIEEGFCIKKFNFNVVFFDVRG